MADIELVEKLRQRANVTYDEAREALDACGDDLLDAVIFLEKKGKVPSPDGGGSYSSKSNGQSSAGQSGAYKSHARNHDSFGDVLGKFISWICDLVKKGFIHTFNVSRKGQSLLTIPVILLIILACAAFWIVVPLLIIGMFLECRYTFGGPDSDNEGINSVIDKVSKATDDFINEMKNVGQDQDKD